MNKYVHVSSVSASFTSFTQCTGQRQAGRGGCMLFFSSSVPFCEDYGHMTTAQHNAEKRVLVTCLTMRLYDIYYEQPYKQHNEHAYIQQ